MKQFLFDEFDIVVCFATIHNYLSAAGWSRKVARRRASERSEELRGVWIGLCLQWRSDQLIFIDESAANERTGDRKFGWSPLDQECEVFSSIKRSERWSILPALDVDGYFEWIVHHGAITKIIFLDFLREQVLPRCEPFPGKRSVLVMDNASIHRGEEVKLLCEQFGVQIAYLPPYSPDKNPIELTFKDLKAWIKRHSSEAANYEVFDGFLHSAVEQNCQRDMRAHFRHCGYDVE
jgi:transposase